MRVRTTSIAIILSIFLLVITSTFTGRNEVVVFPIHLDDTIVTVKIKPIKPQYEHLSHHIQREVKCLADNIYFEARSEPREGKLAVAHVTLNRVMSPGFPSTICGVVQQQNRNVCQFSWWCDNKLRMTAIRETIQKRELYNEIRQIALEMVLSMHDRVDITHGALFYHAEYVSRRSLGSMRLTQTTIIGRHIFYRMDL